MVGHDEEVPSTHLVDVRSVVALGAVVLQEIGVWIRRQV